MTCQSCGGLMIHVRTWKGRPVDRPYFKCNTCGHVELSPDDEAKS